MNKRTHSFRVIGAISVVTLLFLAGIGLLSQKPPLLASESKKKPDIMLLAGAQDCESQGKVTICHNPEHNPHEICVAPQSVEAHLKNNPGDYLGSCQPTPTPTPQPEKSPTPMPTTPPVPQPTPTPEERQVDVVAPQSQQGAWGATLSYTFQVINLGNVEDTYRLTIDVEHNVPTRRIPSKIRLSPGATAMITTSLELPLSGDFRSVQLTLSAVSMTNSSVNDSDSVTTLLAAPTPDVELSKTIDKRVLVPGERVEYTLRYRNTGNVPLENVVIDDTLPEQLHFVESSLPAQILGENMVRMSLEPLLLQGQDGLLTIVARVDEDTDLRGQIVNTAVLSADNLPEPVTAQARSSIEVPKLLIQKSVNKTDVSTGDILLYTMTIINSGNGTAKDVEIIDTLPSVLRYVTGSSVLNAARTDDPHVRSDRQVVWTLGDVGPGDEIIVRYQTTVITGAKSGTYKNRAVLRAQDTGGRTLTAGPAIVTIRIEKGMHTFPAEIHGLVFEDQNSDGYHDANEPGIPKVDVLWIRGRATQATDEDGEFFFRDVEPGPQAIGLYETSLPEGYRLTTDSTIMVMAAEGAIEYVEFGVQSDLAELTAVVYHDLNRNCRYDAGEPGIEGVQLRMDDVLRLEDLFSMTTNGEGKAIAQTLPPSSFSLICDVQTLPPQFVLMANASVPVTLAPRESQIVYFAAAYKPGTIRGAVFRDVNENGRLDSNEHGEPNITLNLTNGSRREILTNDLGQYAFESLEPGVYTLQLSSNTLPPNSYLTVNPVQTVLVEPGQEYIITWGIVALTVVQVSPTPTETPMPIIPSPTPGPTSSPTTTPPPTPTTAPTPEIEEDFCVYTVKAGDTLSRIAARLTGKSGNYQKIMVFNALSSDAIRIGDSLKIPITLLLEQYQSCQFEPPTPTPTPLELGVAEGRIYYDVNANGHYDEDFDIPIPGVIVNIRSDIKTTVTDENGYYRFDNMEPGAHVVWIDPQTLPEPYRPLDDQPIIKIVVYSGGVAATAVADFVILKALIYEETVVEGVVCLDLNNNGDCDPGEPGIVGVTVYDPVVLNVTVEQTNPGKCVGANDPLPVCTAAGQPLPISLCGSVTFTVTIINTGAHAANNMTVTNSMPSGFTPSPQMWTIAQLDPNTSITHDFTYTADCSVVSGDNATTITYTDTFDGQSYSPPIPNQSFTVVPGAITLTKMATLVNGLPILDPITSAEISETSEPPAGIGDVITWRIRVASTGYGHVTNAVVTETLDPGLSFTDGTLGTSRTFTLTKTDLAPRPSATTEPPSNSCTGVDWCEDIFVETTVNLCQDLRNNVSAEWGCDATPCVPAVTAQSSVDFLTRYPYLEYEPEDMELTVPYCVMDPQIADYKLTVHNSGTGFAAAGAEIAVAIPFDVTVISSTINTDLAQPAGVTYDGAQFTIPVQIEANGSPGDTVTINYTVSYPRAGSIDWCGATGSNQSGTLYWQPTYRDQCDNPFTPPVESSPYSVTIAAQPKPSLTVSKSCWLYPSEENIAPLISVKDTEQTVRCQIDVTYSGPSSCGSNTTSDLTLNDDYPDSWTFEGFVNATPPPPYTDYGETDTGSSLTWTIPGIEIDDGDTFSYLQEFTIPPMGTDDVCDSCGQEWHNTVSVSGADCCGCALIVTPAVVTTNVECENPVGLGLLSERFTPAVTEICKEAITLITRYTFTGADWSSVNWAADNVVFTERNDNQMELEGDPEISLDQGFSWCTLPDTAYTDNTPTGGTLVINNFSACTGTGVIGDGATLDVRYDLRASLNSEPQCTAQDSFYDYASLEVSGLAIPTGSNYCPGTIADSIRVDDAVLVEINGSAMTVDIAWNPTPPNGIVGPCGEYDAVITITKTSTEPTYDAVLFLENANYDTLTVTGCSGVLPTNQITCNDVEPDAATEVSGGYAFNFGDFTGGEGQQATINVHVQGRCFTGDPDLVVHLGYNDGCTDQEPDPINLDYTTRRCDAAEDRVVGKSFKSNVLATKFPEQVYAQWDSATNTYKPAQWTITVVNTGTGSAFNVEIVETLGNDLAYLGSLWDKAYTDIQTYPDRLPDNTTEINGASYIIKELKPGESRKLVFRATVEGCQDTTNNVLVRVRCLDMAIDPNISNPEDEWCDSQKGSSVVKFPPTDLVVTTKFSNPIDTCDVANVVITARNAGLTPIYDVRLNQVLPAGLIYQAGQTSYWVETATTGAPPALSDPPDTSTWKGVGSTEPGSPIPAGYGATLVPPKADPPADSSSYYWNADTASELELKNAFTTLNPGETIYIAFQVYVDCEFPQGDLRFYAAFDKCGASTIVSSSESIFRVTPNKPLIEITKTPPEQTISCGSPVQWVIEVTNSATGTAGLPIPARYLRITDTWGGAYTFVGFDFWNGSAWDSYSTLPGTNAITWEMFDLQPDETRRFRLRATFNDCDGTFENLVTAEVRCLLPGIIPDNDPGTTDPGCLVCESGTDPCPPPTEANAINEIPELSIDLIIDPLQACTEDVPIQIELENTSILALIKDLDLDIQLPENVSYVPDSAAVDSNPALDSVLTFYTDGDGYDHVVFYNNDYTTTNLPDLSPGNSVTITFNVDIECDASGYFYATPQFYDCCDDDPVQGESRLDTTWEYPDLRVVKTNTGGPFDCGDEVAWTITVYNDGPVVAEMIRLTDTYGAGLIFDGGSATAVTSATTPNFYETNPSGDTLILWDSANRTITWEIGSLTAGGQRTYTLLTELGSGAACSGAQRENEVEATWHCSTTNTADENPQVNEADCLGGTETVTEDVNVTPTVNVSAIITPTQIAYCAIDTVVTVDITVPATSNSIYNLDATITLPSGLAFHDGGAFNIEAIPATGAAGLATGPMPGEGVISFSFNNTAPVLGGHLADSVLPGTTIRITFNASSSCFGGGDISVQLAYDDCCTNHYTPDATSTNVTPQYPDLQIAIAKNPNTRDVDCDTDIAYTITVRNTGPVAASYGRIRAYLPEWLLYQSSITPTTNPALPSANIPEPGCDPNGASVCAEANCVAGFSNGNIYWEVKDLPSGGTWQTILMVRYAPPAVPDCDNADRMLTVATQYGCPSDIVVWPFDADACTNDGTGCNLYNSRSTTNQNDIPDLQISSASAVVLDECGSGTVTVTISNPRGATGGSNATDFVVRVTGDLTGEITTSLAAGASAIINIPVTTLQQCGDRTFTVTVDADGDICECLETNNSTSGTVTIPCPTLETDKTLITPVTLEPCEAIQYEVVIRNTGAAGTTLNWAANAVIFEETLPAGWVFDSTDSVSGAIAIGDVTSPAVGATGLIQWRAANAITLNGQQFFSIRYTIHATTPVCGASFTNSATVRAWEHCGDEVTATAAVADAVTVQCPAITLTKTDNIPANTVEPCEEVTYTVRLQNSGTGALYFNPGEVVATDSIPENWEFVQTVSLTIAGVNQIGSFETPGEPTAGAATLTWSVRAGIGPLVVAPDETVEVVYTVRAVTTDANKLVCATTFRNEITVRGEDRCGSGYTSTVQAEEFTVICPELLVEKSENIDDDTVEPCEEVTYTLTVTNPASASGPLYLYSNEEVVSDAIPVNWEFVRTVDATAAGVTVPLANLTRPVEPTTGPSTLTWTYTGAPITLLPGQSFVLRYVVRAITTDVSQLVCNTTFQNTATAQVWDNCGSLLTGTAQATPLTVICPELLVEKSENIDDDTVDPCEEVTYTVTVTNPASASGPLYLNSGEDVVNDAIPVNWEFVRTVDATAAGVTVPLANLTRPVEPTTGPSALTWTYTGAPITLLPGQSFVLRYVVRAVTTDASQLVCNTIFQNTVTAQMRDNCGSLLTGTAQAAPITVICPDLTVTKTENILDDTVEPCEEMTYTVTVANPASASGPLYINSGEDVVSDAIPANWEFVRTVDVTSAGNPVDLVNFTRLAEPTDGAATLTWTYTGASSLVLLPGESFVLRYTIRAITTDDNQAVCNVVFQNIATVRARDLCGTLYTDTAQADPITVLCPSVIITKTDNIPDDTVESCEEVTYTATLRNTGAEDLYLNPGAVVMTDGIPENWEFVRTASVTIAGVDQLGSFDAPNEPTAGPAALTWSVNAGVGPLVVAPQETVEVVYVVRAVTTDLNQEVCATAFKNSVTMQARDLCGTVYDGTDQADELTVVCPAIIVTKTEDIDDDTVEPCEEVTYTVTLTNPASATAPLYITSGENMVSDAIPVNWQFVRTVDVTSAGNPVAIENFTRPAEPTDGAATLIWIYVGTSPLVLQPGESFVLHYVIRAITTDDNQAVCNVVFQNMATVQARDHCGTLYTDTAQADPIRVLCPSVTVTKTDNILDDTVKPCEDVTYTATLTNSGAEDLYLSPGAMVMADGIPENWEFVRTISVTVAGVDQRGSFDTPAEPTTGPDTLTWNVSTGAGTLVVAPGETVEVVYVVRAVTIDLNQDVCATIFQNNVTMQARDLCGTVYSGTARADELTVLCPGLDVEKTHNIPDHTIEPCEEVIYTVTATNPGTDDLYLNPGEVIATDSIPVNWELLRTETLTVAGVDLLGSFDRPAEPTNGPASLIWRVNDGTGEIVLPPGQTMVLSYVVRPVTMDTNLEVCAALPYENEVTVSAQDNCGTIYSDTDRSEPIEVICPRLHVVKSSNTVTIQPCQETDNPLTPDVNEPLTYTIEISNTGDAQSTIRLDRITDILDSGWYVVSSMVNPAGIVLTQPEYGESGTLVWTFDPGIALITAGDVVTITVAIAMDTNVNPDACDSAYRFANAVNVEASDLCGIRLVLDPESAPISDEVAVDCPALTVITTAEPEGDLESCEEVTYTITVENTGGAASHLYDIRIRDTVPEHFQVTAIQVDRDGTTLVYNTQYSGSNPADTPLAGPFTLEWFFDQALSDPVLLAPGELITIRVTSYFDENACDTTYTPVVVASAGADQCGLPKTPTERSILTVPPAKIVCPVALLTKELNSPINVLAGGQVEYTITVDNTGGSGSYLYDVIVTDELPSGWRLVSTTVTGGSGGAYRGPDAGATGTLVWSFDGQVVDAGQVLQITVLVSPDETACGTEMFCNQASLTAKTNCGTLLATSTATAPCVTVFCLTPTPTPEPTVPAEPTPVMTVMPEPTVTPTPEDSEDVQFGKRREQIIEIKPCVVVPAEIEKPWFITDIAMYAASEMQRTGHPFIRWSEEKGLALDQSSLAPTGVKEFGAEISKFSVDNVNTVLSNSGIGLHFRHAPVITAGAKAAQLSVETYLAERLQEFAKRSKLSTIPQNMYPIFIEYAEGDPRYLRSVNINNWQSLLWDEQSFVKFLIPSAYGQSLLRQVLLLQEFLATNHHADGTQDLAGEYLGIDDAKGFIGILAAEAIVNKLWFMANTLLQDVEQQDGIVASYFPYKIEIVPESLDTETPDLHVEDDRSRLFDQLSLLWALSELMLLTDKDTPETYQQVFDPNLLAPGVDFGKLARRAELADFQLSAASVHELSTYLASITFKTLIEQHVDFEAGTLFDFASLTGRQQDQGQEDQKTASTLFLGLTLTALERYYHAMEYGQEQREHIVRLMRLAAEILAQYAYDSEDGGVFDALIFDAEAQTWSPSAGELKSLNAQMSAIRGLLAAYDITHTEHYRSIAFNLYQFAEHALWNADLEIYKDREKRGLYTYTPLDVGITIGALRELIYHSADSQQSFEMIQRMKAFVKQITKYAGLQLSEVIARRDQEFLIPVDPVSVIRTAQVLDSPFGLAPVLGAEIALKRDAIAALHAKRPTDSCKQARNAFRSTYYLTDIGMYAATELTIAPQTAGVKAAQTGDDMIRLERNPNPELFYLTGLERLYAKAQDFSALNLLHIQTKSSLGLALEYGPYLRQMAQQTGVQPEKYVQTLLQQYAELTGLEHAPEVIRPIFVEFEGGVPEMEYGKEMERWLAPNMDRSLQPSALGQSLVRQSLWLQEVLTARHDEQNRTNVHGPYLGRNAEEGFLGLLMAQAVANKLLFLRDTMQVPLNSDLVSTPSGHYFPHRFEVDWDGDEPKSFTLGDTASYLFDQVSLLWGLSEFTRFSAPNAMNDMFGNDQVLSGEFHEIAKTSAQRILENLEALHWNSHYDTFYDVNNLAQQSLSSEQDKEEQVISTQNLALAIIALESVYHNFSEDPVMQAAAKVLLLRQIAFLQQYLLRDDGAVYNGARLADEVKLQSDATGRYYLSVYNGARLADEVKPLTGLKTLLSHAAAIRSLLIAYRLTEEHVYLQQAQQVFAFLDATFWDERLQVYRTTLGGSQHRYTPLNTGMTVGAFRELLAIAGSEYTEAMNQHFTKFFEYVIERLGLQLSEQKHLVELTQQPRTVAPVLASDLTIQPLSSVVDINVPQPGSTLIYTIRVTEDALNCDMADAFIEDILPEGVTFVRSVPLPESIDDRVLRWRISDLSADEDGVYTIRIEVIVNSLSSPGFEYDDLISGRRTWRVNNCAWLSCQIPGESERQSRADCVEDQIQLPQLGIEKMLVSLAAEPGKDAEFEIVVTNLSEVTAYTVTVQDVIPAGFIYVKNSARSSDVAGLEIDDTQPLVWVLEDLEPGKSVRFTYKVHLEPQLEDGLYPTQVKVYAMDRSGFAFETNEFEFDIKVERNIFLKIQSHIPVLETQASLQAGQAFTIVTSIENVGTDEVSSGTITVTLPAVLRYIPQTGQINGIPTVEPEIEEQALRWKMGDFPIGSTKTLSYTVRSQTEFVGKATIETFIRGVSDEGMAYESRQYRLDIQFLP